MDHAQKQIAVLDFGGQYAHLIASRVRRLGAYSEIVSPDTLKTESVKERFSGVILSGGPSSVYAEGAPHCDPAIFQTEVPILGICYGHQLMMKSLGADVVSSDSREYGPAQLNISQARDLFENEAVSSKSTVWMSHGDEVRSLPEGFEVIGTTPDCSHAAVAHLEKHMYGIQFHPEVTDTVRGDAILSNFIRICGLENSWDLKDYLASELERIKAQVGDKKVFFLISGGVDSTVAYTLLAKALPPEHLRGLLVDTGFMREGEVDSVRKVLGDLGVRLEVKDAASLYYERLKGVAEPEKKRNIIGELFVDIQESVSDELGLNPEEWYLGQGTIYPDRIESGATKHSHKIKTHHNRVGRIEKLLEAGRVVEPIAELYKDEVRRLGTLMGLPDTVVERHPFPGPGLGVRCLCLEADYNGDREHIPEIDDPNSELNTSMSAKGLHPYYLPVRSVGVQGDQRSYAHPVLLYPEPDYKMNWEELGEIARQLPNRLPIINRVLFGAALKSNPINETGDFQPNKEKFLTPDRMDLLRKADHIVTEFLHEKKLYDKIWQFPVVLVPLYFQKKDGPASPGESIILRPVNSTEAMTASFYAMEDTLLKELANRIIQVPGVDGVFYDLTSKPPGTIEWE